MSWLTVSDLIRGAGHPLLCGSVYRCCQETLTIILTHAGGKKKKWNSSRRVSQQVMTPQAGGGHTQSHFLLPLWPTLLPIIVVNFPYSEALLPVLCGHCHFLSDLQFEFQMFTGGKVSHQWRDARTLSQYSDGSLCQPADWGVVVHVVICFSMKFEMSWKIVLSRTTATASEWNRLKLAGVSALLHNTAGLRMF